MRGLGGMLIFSLLLHGPFEGCLAWGPRVGLMPTWMEGLDAQGEFIHCCAVLIRLVSHGGPRRPMPTWMKGLEAKKAS